MDWLVHITAELYDVCHPIPTLSPINNFTAEIKKAVNIISLFRKVIMHLSICFDGKLKHK